MADQSSHNSGKRAQPFAIMNVKGDSTFFLKIDSESGESQTEQHVESRTSYATDKGHFAEASFGNRYTADSVTDRISPG